MFFGFPSKFKRISSQVTTRKLNTRTQTTTTTMARIKIPIADPWTRIQSDPINLIVLNTSREGNGFIRFCLYIRWSEILLIQNRFLARLLESWLAEARRKKRFWLHALQAKADSLPSSCYDHLLESALVTLLACKVTKKAKAAEWINRTTKVRFLLNWQDFIL